MSDRIEQLASWMAEPEGEHLEFKEAKASFEFEDLVKYCVALANEGGGLPALSRPQIQVLLRELKAEGRAHPVGRTRAGRWYPGPLDPSVRLQPNVSESQ